MGNLRLNCDMLFFGVVIPTKNSMKYLPGHLQNLSAWIDLAQQVVVVDSFSTDGTVDYIKKNLRHPNLHFIEHPPGLFASWNHGIRQLTTEFCYISTVGDSLMRAGAEHLLSTVKLLACDVVISRPRFVDESGEPCRPPVWPIDDLIENLGLKTPVLLPSSVTLATALFHSGGAITGSCASDIFRTSVLQQFPFPTEFGVAGDGAWGIQNAARLRWGVTLEKVATFRCHPPTACMQDILAGKIRGHYSSMAAAAAEIWRTSLPPDYSTQTISDMDRLLDRSIEYDQSCREYNACRKKSWPWILNPAAWRARRRRNQLRQRVFEIRERIFGEARKNLAGIYPPVFSSKSAASFSKLA